MKKLVLISLTFILSIEVFGQTNTFPASGDVGIGTTSPITNLQIDPDGSGGGILIGNSNTGSGGYTSLSMNISSYKSGSGTIQCISSAGSSYGNLLLNPVGGNIGIGTTSPAYPLDVNGEVQATLGLLIHRPTYSDTRICTTNLFQTGPTVLMLMGDNFEFRDRSNNTKMAILNNGNILIGTESDDGQDKLQINGSIKAQKLNITQTGWSDFVFDLAYRLPNLSTTSAYIKAYHHLPGIPSAKRIESKGLNLGDMEKEQMQKIEELTLYIIDLNKKQEALEMQVNQLAAANEKLNAQVKELKSKMK